MSQLLGYTGPVSAEQLPDLRDEGYQPDDLLGQGGLEAQYETSCAAPTGPDGRARHDRPSCQVLQTVREAVPGASLQLTIDTKIQRDAQKALKWAMKKVGMTRGVVIAMNPQTGEILAMVSLPTYDNNQFARGISQAEYKKLLKNKDKPLLNHAVQAHYAPGSTYKLVTGTGGLADREITESTRLMTKPVPDARRDEVLRMEPSAGGGRATSTAGSATRATRSSTRWPACSASTGSAYWATPVRLRRTDRHRPPGRGDRHRPGQRLEAGRLGAPIFPARRTRPGSARAMTPSRRSS